MAGGVYPGPIVIERWQSGSISAATIAQPFIVPDDMEIIGLLLHLGTAPGGSSLVSVNVSNVPTSQPAALPNPYNLWTATNVPTVKGTAVSNVVAIDTATVIENRPYAHNYPLPGPSGTSGYVTSQSTAQTTETPVTTPPTMIIPTVTSLVAPDNTYTDENGFTLVPANIVHAGDILSFVISGASPGSAANLEMVLYGLLN